MIFRGKKIIAAEAVSQKSALEAVDAFRRHGLSCFVYTYEENGISIYYEDEVLQAQTQYYSDRALESCEEVKLVEDVREVLAEKKPVYLAYTGFKEVLEPVCEELDNIEEISYSFYLNVYNGWYCLEVFSEKASKKNALLKLQDLLKCQEIVVFGDNLNDISMIEIADRSYAPQNALEEVKKWSLRFCLTVTMTVWPGFWQRSGGKSPGSGIARQTGGVRRPLTPPDAPYAFLYTLLDCFLYIF